MLEQSSFIQYVLFSWFLWGLLFLILALYLSIQAFFSITIPYVKVFLAVVLAYCGIMVMVSGFSPEKSRDSLILNEGKLTAPKPSNHFKVLAGRGTIDLTQVPAQENSKPQTVDVILGWGTLMLDAGTPALVNIDSIYSSLSMPGMKLAKKTGDVTYVSNAYDGESEYITVRARVWLGSFKVYEIEKKRKENKPAQKKAS